MKNGYISPICPEDLDGRISTKFCTAVEVVDIITCDKLFSDRLRDVDSVRVKNAGFPLTKPVADNTELRKCTACDSTSSLLDSIACYQNV